MFIADEPFVRVALFLFPPKHRDLFVWAMRSETAATVSPSALRGFLETLALIQWARAGAYGLVAVLLLYLRYRLGLPAYVDAAFYFILFWSPLFMLLLALVWTSLRRATVVGRTRLHVLRLSHWMASFVAASVAVWVASR